MTTTTTVVDPANPIGFFLYFISVPFHSIITRIQYKRKKGKSAYFIIKMDKMREDLLSLEGRDGVVYKSQQKAIDIYDSTSTNIQQEEEEEAMFLCHVGRGGVGVKCVCVLIKRAPQFLLT